MVNKVLTLTLLVTISMLSAGEQPPHMREIAPGVRVGGSIGVCQVGGDHRVLATGDISVGPDGVSAPVLEDREMTSEEIAIQRAKYDYAVQMAAQRHYQQWLAQYYSQAAYHSDSAAARTAEPAQQDWRPPPFDGATRMRVRGDNVWEGHYIPNAYVQQRGLQGFLCDPAGELIAQFFSQTALRLEYR